MSANNQAAQAVHNWWSNHSEYYRDAFVYDYQSIWRGVEPPDEEIYWRCYYRALTCFLRTDPESIIDRRKLLYSYVKSEYKTEHAHDTLNRYRKQLPVDSTVRRVVRNICTAYDAVPDRMFSDDERVQTVMDDLYSQLNMATRAQRIYHRARLTGMVAARPVYRAGKWYLDFMTPDEFMLTADPDDDRSITAFTYARSSNEGIEYVTWTADNIITRGYNGKEKRVDENPYKRIPYAILRLADDDGVYTGGMFELVESQLDVNKTKWQATVNVTFAGSPVWVATNFPDGDIVISPDRVIVARGVTLGEGQDVPPQLDAVTPESAYEAIQDHATNRERQMQMAEGIPLSMLTEQGNPPSGVARMIERMELTEMRYSDQRHLRSWEKELAKLTALVADTDAGVAINPDSVDVDVSYQDEPVTMDVKEEYELDKMKLADLTMSADEFYQKWAGVSDITEELPKRRAKLTLIGGAVSTPQPPATDPE